MNERRRSPRLNKIPSSTETSSNSPTCSQSLNRPKSNKSSRVSALKNIKKIAQKKSNSQATRCLKNGAKFANTRKSARSKESPKKAAKKRRRRAPVSARTPRRSQRLIERRNQLTHTGPLSTVNSSSPRQSSADESSTQISSIANSASFQMATTSAILSESCVSYLKSQLRRATIKFDKACRQLSMLDQQMNDLQNSYSNSLENERKTFKIIYRMQLATYEGAHNAYIQYIERQVEKIKKLKTLLFNDSSSADFVEAND